MSSLRQVGTGLLYALVSVVLVVGGLSLALAEGGLPALPPPTATLIPSVTQVPPSATQPEASTTNTEAAAVPTTQPAIVITATQPRPAATNTLRPLPTITRQAYSPTMSACGPYYGWVRTYTVKSGDTLFHIATLYRTTVTALQTANCRSSTTIYPGELLWVPNVATATPGVTIIPTFPTDTPVPTEPLTLTPPPLYFTATAVPTDTSNPDP